MLHPFSRRHFLKGTALALGAFALNGFYGTAHAVPGNVLVAYFSWSGNTRGIARLLHQKIGGELVEIEPATPYSEDYNTCLEQAKRDQERAARPELKTHIADMTRYDVVFLGYPNWWATIPMPIASFLEQYDFSGKNHCALRQPRQADAWPERHRHRQTVPFLQNHGSPFRALQRRLLAVRRPWMAGLGRIGMKA